MKRTLLTLFLTIGVAFGALAEAKWLTDIKVAKEQAEKEKKPIFMLFTGSDWCPPCMYLEKEFFSKKEFEDFANKDLILLKIDFPQTTTLSKEQNKHNEDLAEKYKVEGTPTMIIVDAKEKKLAEVKLEEFQGVRTPADFVKVIENKLPKKK